MKVSKWGNSLAVRIPADLATELQLKEGDEIELRSAGDHELSVARKPKRQELIESLRKYRGRMPADFKFDRDEANER